MKFLVFLLPAMLSRSVKFHSQKQKLSTTISKKSILKRPILFNTSIWKRYVDIDDISKHHYHRPIKEYSAVSK